jgi:hypothetical protein
MLHGSNILFFIENSIKIPESGKIKKFSIELTPEVLLLEKIQQKKTNRMQSKQFDQKKHTNPGELKEILKVCGNTVSVTKTPTFAIHQMDAMTTVEKEIAKASRKEFKNSVEFAKRVNRYLRSTPNKKNPSKQTPKGTVVVISKTIPTNTFVCKKNRKRIEATRLRTLKAKKRSLSIVA